MPTFAPLFTWSGLTTVANISRNGMGHAQHSTGTAQDSLGAEVPWAPSVQEDDWGSFLGVGSCRKGSPVLSADASFHFSRESLMNSKIAENN